MLNDRNENTKYIIHIMVTSLCNRNCKFCCNNQYDLDSIPHVTEEELTEAHTILLTGGEPFKYAQPNEIAKYYKKRYPNIKNVYVYGNAKEFDEYMGRDGSLDSIDGVSISIKTNEDMFHFESLVSYEVLKGRSNILYNFLNIEPHILEEYKDVFKIIKRTWQKEFKPSPNSIFRRI